MIPGAAQRPARPRYSSGLFAAPWADEPILPAARSGTDYRSSHTSVAGELRVARSGHAPGGSGGADQQGFMQAIRDQAIFAWALTGINGALYEHKIGTPMGEALPPDGISIWAQDANQPPSGTQKSTGSHSSQETVRPPPQTASKNIGPQIFGDPGQDSKFLQTRSGSKQS